MNMPSTMLILIGLNDYIIEFTYHNKSIKWFNYYLFNEGDWNSIGYIHDNFDSE